MSHPSKTERTLGRDMALGGGPRRPPGRILLRQIVRLCADIPSNLKNAGEWSRFTSGWWSGREGASVAKRREKTASHKERTRER